MNFAQEVASAASGKPSVETVVSKPDVKVSEDIPVLPTSLPSHGEQHPETKTPEAPVEKKVSAPIRIGGEVFESPEEAIRYAEELQLTLAQKDAYEQGRKEALGKPVEEKPKEPDFYEEIENELFSNPKDAIRKVYDKVTKDIEEKYQKQKEFEKQEAIRQENIRKTWEGFYSENQDLVANKELVDFVLEKNWKDLGNLSVEKSLKLLAEKTRALLSSKKETTLPTRELQSNKVVTNSATSSATATPVKKESSALDFISQINKHRKRTV